MSTRQLGKRTEGIKRRSFEELGICKERYLQLKAGCESGMYGRETLLQACRNMPEGVAGFVLKSVTEGRTFERVEFDDKLGRICVGRTNFYALRRQFYHDLDCLLRNKQGKSSMKERDKQK